MLSLLQRLGSLLRFSTFLLIDSVKAVKCESAGKPSDTTPRCYTIINVKVKVAQPHLTSLSHAVRAASSDVNHPYHSLSRFAAQTLQPFSRLPGN